MPSILPYTRERAKQVIIQSLPTPVLHS
uniref:Uncharacterized protein n=1 Tax=Triticum urartu TaxID=4572 RepID=A0A8R7TWC4_TRIUA